MKHGESLNPERFIRNLDKLPDKPFEDEEEMIKKKRVSIKKGKPLNMITYIP